MASSSSFGSDPEQTAKDALPGGRESERREGPCRRRLHPFGRARRIRLSVSREESITRLATAISTCFLSLSITTEIGAQDL